MEHGTSGLAYNIGGGSEISLLDALALCERIVGQPLDLHRGPPVAGDARRTIADISLASADLGWTPTTSLEDGLRAQAESAAVPEPEPEPIWAEAS